MCEPALLEPEQVIWLEKMAEEHNLGLVGKTLRDLIDFYGELPPERLQSHVEKSRTGSAKIPISLCDREVQWLKRMVG